MGEWRLICPKGDIYAGECEFMHTNGFILKCPKGVRKISAEGEGCEGIVNPGELNPEIPEYCEFVEEKVKPKEYFHIESFRTLCPECPERRCAKCPPELACATRIIIGCKKEEWDERTGRCKIGTETHVIYHGKPKEKA